AIPEAGGEGAGEDAAREALFFDDGGAVFEGLDADLADALGAVEAARVELVAEGGDAVVEGGGLEGLGGGAEEELEGDRIAEEGAPGDGVFLLVGALGEDRWELEGEAGVGDGDAHGGGRLVELPRAAGDEGGG